jgi:hypothetical protein
MEKTNQRGNTGERFATLMRANALQTASRFPRETRRRFAVPKSNVITLISFRGYIDNYPNLL